MKIAFGQILQGASLMTTWLIKAAADGNIDAHEWAELGIIVADTLGIPTTVQLVKPEQPTEETEEKPAEETPPADEEISPKLKTVDQ